MTAREFAIGVMWALIFISIAGGAWAWLSELISTLGRNRYWMPRDVHDDQRRIARNGERAWLGKNP